MPFIVKSQPETLKKSSITSVSEDFHKNFFRAATFKNTCEQLLLKENQK